MSRHGGPAAARQGYSRQGTSKQIEGTNHPDRDPQFRYLNDRVGEHVATGQPVISVDTRRKELVGAFADKGPGAATQRFARGVQINDFVDQELGRAVP